VVGPHLLGAGQLGVVAGGDDHGLRADLVPLVIVFYCDR
jgi:hypothetical protein